MVYRNFYTKQDESINKQNNGIKQKQKANICKPYITCYKHREISYIEYTINQGKQPSVSSKLAFLLSGRWSNILARGGAPLGGAGGNGGGLGLRPPARDLTSVRCDRRTSAKRAAISADFFTLRASWEPAPVERTGMKLAERCS